MDDLVCPVQSGVDVLESTGRESEGEESEGEESEGRVGSVGVGMEIVGRVGYRMVKKKLKSDLGRGLTVEMVGIDGLEDGREERVGVVLGVTLT